MALIECPECRKMISEQASICPNCGFKLSKYRTKKHIKDSIGTLKKKRIHTRKQALKSFFDVGIESILDKIHDIPIVGGFLWWLILMTLTLIAGIVVFGIPALIVYALFQVNMLLGCIVFDIFMIALQYFIWYKDRRWKFWFFSIFIIVATIAIVYTINNI